MAQEALTNVARHAGVDTAAMHLSFQSGQVGLLVEDSGRGCDLRPGSPVAAGLGLAGMRERVESIGGRLLLDAAPGRGVRVEVRVPVDFVVTTSVVQAQLKRLKSLLQRAPLSLISLHRFLKLEVVHIVAFYPPGMNHQLPGSIEPRLRGL